MPLGIRGATVAARDLREPGERLPGRARVLDRVGDPERRREGLRRLVAPREHRQGLAAEQEPARLHLRTRCRRAPARRLDVAQAERVEENLDLVGRVFHSVSTLVCTPASLSQEVGLALGAQAGEGRLRGVLERAGFTRVRRTTETPFNLVIEARP